MRNSIEDNYGCAACLSMSMLGEEGFPGACESDAMGALTMLALNIASGGKSAYMDWNNNFTEDRNICINQHCGNFPKSFFGSPNRDLKPGHPCQGHWRRQVLRCVQGPSGRRTHHLCQDRH